MNSGAWLEAIIHGKRVFKIGNADYASASERIIYGGSTLNEVNSLNYALKTNYDKNEDLSSFYKLFTFLIF